MERLKEGAFRGGGRRRKGMGTKEHLLPSTVLNTISCLSPFAKIILRSAQSAPITVAGDSPLISIRLDLRQRLTDSNVFVRPETPHLAPHVSSSARYTENPFASTHSLDTNPFDDPAPGPAHAARMEELAQRERDLERRETELTQKADHIKRHGRNNFPPCKSLPNTPPYPGLTLPTVYPLIYHSIPDEIPEASRPLITRLFQLWMVLGATLLFNMVACIINFAVGAKDGGSDLGSSIGYDPLSLHHPHHRPHSYPRYFIFITPFSFLLWYR